MIKLVNSQPMAVGKTVAENWLSNYVYKGQRQLRDSKVDMLAKAMLDGRFTDGDVVIARQNGSAYLLDGQHTLWAISTAAEQDPSLTVDLTIKWFEVDDEEDLAHLYSTIDIGTRRNMSDFVRAASLGEMFGVPEQYASRLAAACGLIVNGLEHVKSYALDSDVIVQAFKKWAPTFADLLKLLDKANASRPIRKAILRRDTLAVALVTLRAQPQMAVKFWQDLAADDGLHRGDPRKTLRDWLLENQGGDTVGRKPDYSIERGLKANAAAWNAFCGNRALQRIIVTDSPLELAGVNLKKLKEQA